jgi:uncharacterized NAD(P)/FAD-binding protein YdhS
MKQTETDRDAVLKVAIIGGGFSGANLAAALLRAGGQALSVVVIERQGERGRGVAYGTQCDGHLLNVRAESMSGREDDSLHFLRWAKNNYDAAVEPGDYVPRRLYGRYVESVLREADESNPGRLEWKRDEGISIRHLGGKAEISLRGGSSIVADKIVLALGNFPPSDPRLPGRGGSSPRYVSNPWAANALAAVGQEKAVLLIGSGLTGVDVAIALRERNFEGKIHMLSRHGLLPQQHKPAESWPAFWHDEAPRTARGMLRLIREQVGEAEQRNSDWRAVIDSLRPFTQKIWSSLPLKEQRNFFRHLRAYWDVHRHRVAPQIGAMLTAEMAEGRIEAHAGRITEYRESTDGIEVSYRDRGSEELRKVSVDRVINCTGPDADVRRINDPLLKDVLSQNLVRPVALFQGLDTAENGALIDGSGIASDSLYTIGPLRKGNLWETIAVPEIRAQASQLAWHLVSSAGRRTSGGGDFNSAAPVDGRDDGRHRADIVTTAK